ncbi:MAG: hypothetical protein IJ024_00365 [Lachnospiraceae bacterium]|nr:hypothetical protein [Lachnospiraceae bacterium]
MNKIKVLFPFIIIYAILVLLVYVLRGVKNQNKTTKHYDERQLLIQGKAYKYSFFTLLAYLIGIGVLNVILDRDFATTYVYACIGLCLGLIVYVTYSLFKDAYIGMKESANLSVGVAFLVGICNAGPSLFNLDKVMKNGVLQNTTAQLIMGLTFIYVGIILFVKKQLDKREV